MEVNNEKYEKAQSNNGKKKIIEMLKRPYIGIPLILVGLLLLLSPLLTNAYTNYHQEQLLAQYQEGMDIEIPEFDELMMYGVPTVFENVIIKIPRLDVTAAVVPPPVEYCPDEYLVLLRRGPVFLTQSFPPGAIGNVAITGHRLDHGDHFKDLDFLEEGDEIILETPAFIITYEFVESAIVDEYDWDLIIDHSDVRRLVLHTCEPKTTRQHTPDRLIVRAEMKDMEPRPGVDIPVSDEEIDETDEEIDETDEQIDESDESEE